MSHTIHIKVYYEDTDAGGVVYYANYLRFLERARTELLLGHGVHVADYHNKGIYFVIAHVDITYRKPARLGEIIDVTTAVKEVRNASMVLHQTVTRAETLLAEADVTIACVDQRGKPIRLPEGLRNLPRETTL
jgi:acyl-CoA thioester hydrolase